MILEGLVTTTDADGGPHLAPMGPAVDAALRTFRLRPFPTSATYRNLLRDGVGVLHVTDDAALIARAALGRVTPFPPTQAATHVRGWVLSDACRAFEFRVTSIDPSAARVEIVAEVVHAETLREFFGFNRAKHAVVEAAILATRFHMLPPGEVAAEFRKLRVTVEKTGGPAEFGAMAFLDDALRQYAEAAR